MSRSSKGGLSAAIAEPLAGSEAGGARPHSGHKPLAGPGSRRLPLGLPAAGRTRLLRPQVKHPPRLRVANDKLPRRSGNRGILLVTRKHDRALRTDAGAGRAARLALVRVAHLHFALGVQLVHAEQAELQAVPALDTREPSITGYQAARRPVRMSFSSVPTRNQCRCRATCLSLACAGEVGQGD